MIQNEGINNQDPQKIQDQFILHSNIIQFQYRDGQIYQIQRRFQTIEGLKDASENSYEIIQLINILKQQLTTNFGYEIVKYEGRNNLWLQFLAKQRGNRVIHQIACLIAKQDKLLQQSSLQSILNKLTLLEHINVQKIITCQQVERFYFVIMEDCIGSYQDLLLQSKMETNQNSYLKYAGEFMQGLEYLVDRVQISSSVCELSNVMISFNHIGKVPLLVIAKHEISKGGAMFINEYINSVSQQIYQNGNNQQLVQIQQETIANHVLLAHLLIQMLIPTQKHQIFKNYISQNKASLLKRINHYEFKEQLLDLIMDIESQDEMQIDQFALSAFIDSISSFKVGKKWFQRPLDISITQTEQSILATNFINYDFVQVSQKNYIPLIDLDLVNSYFHTYQKQLYQMKQKNSQQYNSEYYHSLISIPLMKDQSSASKANEMSTIIQNSYLRNDLENRQMQFQNIQILEDYILDRVEDIYLDSELEIDELKGVIDSLCSHNENGSTQQSSTKFDNQIYEDIVERIKQKGGQINLHSFLEAYLDLERELIILYNQQQHQHEFTEGSFYGKHATLILDKYSFVRNELDSPLKEKEKAHRDILHSHDHELQSAGNQRELKEKIQILHKPFSDVFNPPQNLKDLTLDKFMQEVLSIKSDAKFKVEMKEEDIFGILKALCIRNSKHMKKPEFDKKPFNKIFELMQKRNQTTNLNNFLNIYLEACNELQTQLVNLIVQNCDIKSLDTTEIKQIVTFHNVRHNFDSIHELNYIDFMTELQSLKVPFRRIFQKANKSVNYNSIKKKKNNNPKFQHIPNFDNEQYISQLDTNTTPISRTQSLILTIIIILFSLALLTLILYCIW